MAWIDIIAPAMRASIRSGPETCEPRPGMTP